MERRKLNIMDQVDSKEGMNIWYTCDLYETENKPKLIIIYKGL
jgi:hypothetical protein